MIGKKDLLFLLVIAVAGVVYFYFKYQVPKLESTEIRFLEDESFVRVSELEEDKVVVIFFASWCGHCIQEIPSLNLAKNKFEEKGIRVLLVTDDEPVKIKQSIERYSINYPVYPLDGTIKSFGVHSIPATFFFSKGKLIHSFNGVIDWSSKETELLLDQHFSD